MKINPFTILEWAAWAFLAGFVLLILVACISAMFGLALHGVDGI